MISADEDDIVRYLREISPARAAQIGAAMRVRALSDHSYELRAREVDQVLASAEPVPDAEEKIA